MKISTFWVGFLANYACLPLHKQYREGLVGL